MLANKMTADELIDALKIVVHDSSVHGIESSLQRPSGRRPPPNLVAASAWFNSLKEDDREIIRLIIAQSIHSAIFGVLIVRSRNSLHGIFLNFSSLCAIFGYENQVHSLDRGRRHASRIFERLPRSLDSGHQSRRLEGAFG